MVLENPKSLHRSQNKALVIHAGASKTGSSALQVAFAKNQEWLSAQGIHYPKTGAFDAAASGRITSGNGAELAKHISGQIDKPELIEQVVNMLERSDGRRVLLSSEFFQFAYAKPDRFQLFIDRVRATGYEVNVVYFVRAYCDWLWSLYVQNVKNHSLTDSFSGWPRKSKAIHQYTKAIHAFDEVVGRDNVVIVNYDSSRDDIFNAFIRVAFGLKEKVASLGPERVNRSLTDLEIEIMRGFHRLSKDKAQGALLSAMLITASPNAETSPHLDAELDAFISSEVEEHIDFINQRIIGGPLTIGGGHLLPVPADSEAHDDTIQRMMPILFKLLLDSQLSINVLSRKLDLLIKQTSRSEE